MELALVRNLYDYHQWANRRLFDVAAALGDEVAGRDVGKQFSVPTLRGMFAHVYGADWVWLERWKGAAPSRIASGADFATMADLRKTWDAFEVEQRRFIDGLTPADLSRELPYKGTDGKPWTAPLGPMLQHVANHATHHRSEIATMITMVSGSPPPTDLIVYQRIVSGQLKG
ncbi:MAG TPA: DinB family protein [Methylomirabilota bacterium]|jgi:uncharacterized damage-inducible protein DinB|nr:DinB family protein [Methylomirabilota bacterium]